jgi:hypothetical protein
MTFFEAIAEKNKMISDYPNAIHLEIIDWNNKRESVVLKNQQQVQNFRLMYKGWDVEINEIR